MFEPIGRVTSLEAPHRIADAILRDSELNGKPFRSSDEGKKIIMATLRVQKTIDNTIRLNFKQHLVFSPKIRSG